MIINPKMVTAIWTDGNIRHMMQLEPGIRNDITTHRTRREIATMTTMSYNMYKLFLYTRIPHQEHNIYWIIFTFYFIGLAAMSLLKRIFLPLTIHDLQLNYLLYAVVYSNKNFIVWWHIGYLKLTSLATAAVQGLHAIKIVSTPT